MLKKILLIGGLLFFIGVGLNFVYSFFLLQNAEIKSSYASKGKINAQVLIHGPCEPFFTINPQQLSAQIKRKSYNLSLTHSDFADNYLHLYLYLKKNKSPNIVLLYVTPESFDERFNTFHTYRFSAFLNDDTVKKVVVDNDSAYTQWMNIPLLKYTYFGKQLNYLTAQGFSHWLKGKTTPANTSGYQEHLPSPLRYAHDSVKKSFPAVVSNLLWSIKREKYLLKIIALLKSKGIRLILYESPGNASSFALQKNRKERIGQIKKIAEKHNLLFWTFEQSAISQKQENFVCPLIMNSASSRSFTDTLALRLNKLK